MIVVTMLGRRKTVYVVPEERISLIIAFVFSDNRLYLMKAARAIEKRMIRMVVTVFGTWETENCTRGAREMRPLDICRLYWVGDTFLE